MPRRAWAQRRSLHDRKRQLTVRRALARAQCRIPKGQGLLILRPTWAKVDKGPRRAGSQISTEAAQLPCLGAMPGNQGPVILHRAGLGRVSTRRHHRSSVQRSSLGPLFSCLYEAVAILRRPGSIPVNRYVDNRAAAGGICAKDMVRSRMITCTDSHVTWVY